MGFFLPTFNLTCNIWRSAAGPPAPPAVVSECNLAMGRRTQDAAGTSSDENRPFHWWWLLLPKNTDIRDYSTASGDDLVEVPAGTGRFYRVNTVDDAGKGFLNEHRVAIMTKDLGVNWPEPIP